MSEAQINRFQQNVIDSIAAGGVQGGAPGGDGGGDAGAAGGGGAGGAGDQGGDAGGQQNAGGEGDKGGDGAGDKGAPAGGNKGQGGDQSILGGAPQPGADGAKGGGDGQPQPIEITLPEGAHVDEAVLGGFKEVAQKVGLDSAKATEIASWYAAEQQKTAKAWAEGETPIQKGWKDQLAKDPDFGGDKLPDTVLAARRVVEAYGGQAAREAFTELGIGNHPVIVRMLARIGRSMGEDSGVGGSGGSPGKSKQEVFDDFYNNPGPK